jgi:hypothetical protein
MSQSESKIRPATQALDALIRRTISQVRETANATTADTMLFLGDRHQAFPARLVQDPVLEPVDKVVWLVICQHGQAAGASTAFPSYNAIARQANIASPATVSRAIALLRATRWLSVCAWVRDGGGRVRGNVYALHDEPLPLADAMHLDPDYLTFVKAARQHHHARVRKVADAVLAAIDDDSKAGVDVLAPVPVNAQRHEGVREASPRRYFTFSATVLPQLANRALARPMNNRDPESKNDTDRLQNLSPQKSKSVGSSSYINNITTTTKTKRIQKLNTDPGCESLIYPRRLIADQREMAARYLASVPVEQRQPVLDELEGRFRAEKQGAKPVYDELRYLRHLCTQVNAGGFQFNLGLKVQGERARRAQEGEIRQQTAQTRKEDCRRPRARHAAGESPFAEARKVLGLPPSNHAPTRSP